jgi:MFS family permease
MKDNQLILVLGLAGFVVMADNWVVSPILPAIAKSLQVSPVRAGLLISAYMIPFGLFQLVFGPLADRYEPVANRAWYAPWKNCRV